MGDKDHQRQEDRNTQGQIDRRGSPGSLFPPHRVKLAHNASASMSSALVTEYMTGVVAPIRKAPMRASEATAVFNVNTASSSSWGIASSESAWPEKRQSPVCMATPKVDHRLFFGVVAPVACRRWHAVAIKVPSASACMHVMIKPATMSSPLIIHPYIHSSHLFRKLAPPSIRDLPAHATTHKTYMT